MCGICGILVDRPRPGGDEESAVRVMTDTLLHRGPDGTGLHMDGERGVYLGHTRLAIIDLSPQGRQPMTNENGDLHLVCNGEIYNHRELRRDLEKRGHRFRSASDSEVILHLYEEEGARMVPLLDGMFAFALWDEGRERLLLARDPIGIKPLYYSHRDGRFLFGSSPKSILAHPDARVEADDEGIWHYLTFNCAPAPYTLFRGIRKLPAGSTLHMERGNDPKIESYWDFPSRPAEQTDREEAGRKLRQLLVAGTKKRLMSDVPVGAYLSGGIDSTINVGLMAPLLDEPMHTFSVGYTGDGQSELPYARRAAERFGTVHRGIILSPSELEEAIPPMIEQMDDPIGAPSVLSNFLLARAAREDDVPVVQVGEGADELLFGYHPARRALILQRLVGRHFQRLPLSLRRALHKVMKPLLAAAGDPPVDDSLDGTLVELLRRGARDEPLFWGFANLFSETAKEKFCSGFPGEWRSFSPLEPVFDRIAREGWDFPVALSYINLKVGLAERLLMRVDKTNMAFAVEARVPFLDRELAEFAFHLPARWNTAGAGKRMLRESFRDLLPPEILSRKKMGFPTPHDVFLGDAFLPEVRRMIIGSTLRERNLFDYERIEEILDAFQRGRRLFLYPVWSLLVLSLWHDRWIAGRRDR